MAGTGIVSGDAALIEAYLTGDASAFAELYDRYSDRIHDLCLHMSGHPADAADATADTFLAAASNLGRLRERDKFVSWLYAIARNQVYAQSRARQRERPDDRVGDMIEPIEDTRFDDLVDSAGDPARATAVLREAAVGLDDRDRLVLELTLAADRGGRDQSGRDQSGRDQGDGFSIADALGMSETAARQASHRMRERLARSVGALAVARQGRADCAELDGVLANWDGAFSVVWRKRVARHVDGCEICERRRKLVPATLFGSAAAATGTPISFVAAPPSVRDRVLADLGRPTEVPSAWSRSGFPRDQRRAPRLAIALVVLVALVLFAAGIGIGAQTNTDDVSAGVRSSNTVASSPATPKAATSLAGAVPAPDPSSLLVPSSGPVPSTPEPTTAPVDTTRPTTVRPATTLRPATTSPPVTTLPPNQPPVISPTSTSTPTTTLPMTTLPDAAGPRVALRFPALRSGPCPNAVLQVTAIDPSGVASVSATYTGRTSGSLTFSPTNGAAGSTSATAWSVSWSPGAAGTHLVTVTARDTRGNATLAAATAVVGRCVN